MLLRNIGVWNARQQLIYASEHAGSAALLISVRDLPCIWLRAACNHDVRNRVYPT